MPVLNQLIYNVDRGVGLRLDFKVLSKVLIPAFMHTQLIPDCDLLKMRKPFIAFDFKEGLFKSVGPTGLLYDQSLREAL